MIQLKRQKTTYVKWKRNVFIIVKSACEINYCRSFHYNSNAVHARRLQCSHQPISNWHQEHFDHHQHGVAELLQWAAQEEARRGWWLRCFMMEKTSTTGLNLLSLHWEACLDWKTTSSLKHKCCCSREKLLWRSSKKRNPSLFQRDFLPVLTSISVCIVSCLAFSAQWHH